MTSQKSDHLNVICYKWGTLYSPDYVNILAKMVERHLSIPYTFHCLTDDPEGLAAGINIHKLPDYGIQGNWQKLMAFQTDFLGLKGQLVVSMDIDVVIIGSLDFLADYPEKDFMIARNWAEGGSRGSGSLYRVRVGSHPEIWENFIANPEKSVDQFHAKTRLGGEQNWLDHHFETFEHFPDGKVVSYKKHLRSKGRIIKVAGLELLNTARFGTATPPPGAAMVSFHGDPSPQDVMNSHSGRWRHAPFVKEHWR